MNGLIVRASTEADVARCAEIYGHHVLYGTASFEETPPDLAEMKKRRAAVLARRVHPRVQNSSEAIFLRYWPTRSSSSTMRKASISAFFGRPSW